MADMPITLQPAEQQAHREGRLLWLVRAAEKCKTCVGSALNLVDDDPGFDGCPDCNGTGYKPLGQPQLGEACKTHCLPVTSVELVRLWEYANTGKGMGVGAVKAWDANNPDTPWSSNPFVWKVGVAQGEGS